MGRQYVVDIPILNITYEAGTTLTFTEAENNSMAIGSFNIKNGVLPTAVYSESVEFYNGLDARLTTIEFILEKVIAKV